MRKEKHIHKYQRFAWGRGGMYKCMVTDCTHFLVDTLAIGRTSICWGGCGNTVVISQADVSNSIKKPYCDSCKIERSARRAAIANIGNAEQLREFDE